jgi:hypothetical protein
MRAVLHFRVILLIGMVFPGLAGCGHMPVTSMVRLAPVDFQTTDPDKLRVAVRLPRMLKVRAEGTVLRITVGLASGASEARNFALRAVSESDAPAGEGAVFVFALTPRDGAELRLFRAGLMQRQKGLAGGSLAIAVQPDVCRSVRLPDGPGLFTTYLKTGETDGYVPLGRDVDLRTLVSGEDIAMKIPECR